MPFSTNGFHTNLRGHHFRLREVNYFFKPFQFVIILYVTTGCGICSVLCLYESYNIIRSSGYLGAFCRGQVLLSSHVSSRCGIPNYPENTKTNTLINK